MPPSTLDHPRPLVGGLPGDCEGFAGKLTWDAAFEKMDPAQKKGRLARLSYEFACMDTVGANQRVYPKALWAEAASQLNQKCASGRVWGRLDHPSPWDPNAFIPTLEDASHRVVSCEALDGKNAKVVLDILDNPAGRQIMALRACEGDVCLSQRAGAMWRDMTDGEKQTYGLDRNSAGQIADGLRLVTFDVVSQPGFADAGNPTATESSNQGQTTMWKNAAEMRADAGGVKIANEIADEARTAAVAELPKKVNEAVEAAKPEIIKAATEPLKAKITEQEKAIADARQAFEAIIPALGKLGIKLEQVADTALASRASAAETKLATTEAALKAANEALASAETARKTAEDRASREAALNPIRAKYAKSPFLEKIIKACEGAKDANEAQTKAAAVLADLNSTLVLAGRRELTQDAFEGVAADPNRPAGANGQKPKADNDDDESPTNIAGGIARRGFGRN